MEGTPMSPEDIKSCIDELFELSMYKIIRYKAKYTVTGTAYLNISEAMQTFLALLSVYSLSALP